MKVTYIRDIGWKRLMLTGDNIKKIGPQFYKNILQETADIIANDWWSRVHIITGRTKNSIGVSIPSPTQITVYGAFGAYWEEKKGGSHAGLAKAVQLGKTKFAGIAQSYMVDGIQSAIKGKTRPTKQPRYIRKWKNAQTGRWQYEYANTGYMGGTQHRAGGFSTRKFPTST